MMTKCNRIRIAVLMLACCAMCGTPADASPPQPVTYRQLVQMIDLQLNEAAILKRIQKSPTVFTLSAEQIQELKRRKVSPEFIRRLQQSQVANQKGQSRNLTDLAIVFDASRSMAGKTAEGITKMQAAKQAVAKLIRGVRPDLNVTFIVYGHDRKLQCAAVKVVRDLGRLDAASKEALLKYIAGLEPSGNTPIARALEAAGRQLAASELPGIVLITDGIETCHGKPTEVAARLARKHKWKFGVHVVGFQVTTQEKAALEEIVNAAGAGKATNPKNAKELLTVINHITEQVGEVERPSDESSGNDSANPLVRRLIRRIVAAKWTADGYDVDHGRNSALKALTKLAPELVARTLADAMRSPDKWIRRWAAGNAAVPQRTSQADKRRQLDSLKHVIVDSKWSPDGYGVDHARKAAAASMQKLSPKSLNAALAGAMDSKSTTIRDWAFATLAKLKTRKKK